MSLLYASCFFFFSLVPCARSGHQDLRKELAAVRELVITVERKLNSLTLPDIGRKLTSFETSINTLMHKVTDINRKSQLLSEIHQDNDARKEVLQRMSRSLEDINRKQLTFLEKKNEVEIDRLDKLSENVQALFQIFGGMNRKIDDLQTRVERISNVCPTSDLKFFITKKIDSLTASMAMLSECLECDRDSLKQVLQSFLRQPLDNVIKKCGTTGDVERNLGRMFDSKLKGMSDSLQSSVQTKLQAFNTQIHGAIEECSCKNPKLTAHDIAYSSDTHQEQRTVGKSEESPGRIFRKLWRKMIEPINKVGEKIESLSQTIEVSNDRHHNATLSKLKEWTGKSGKDGGETCSKQLQGVQNATKQFAEKLEQIETRQISVQSTTNKILSEMERVRSNIKGSNTVFVPGITEAYIEGPGGDGYVGTNCADIQMQGLTRNGIYTLKPKDATDAFIAYCDLETDGGGWTVLQRRGDYGEEFRQNFTQSWEVYKHGFGDPQREFWIGNEKIHLLSVQEEVKLRVELMDFDENTAYAEYTRFRVEDEGKQYRLYVSGYHGNATDSLSLHDNKMFSTYDRDNDEVASCCNCADTFKGGWWYYRCFEANLNGPYHTDPTENGYFLGIIWERWKGDYSLKSSEMKIRPLNFEDLRDP